ncbi:MAG: autotransporter domain-containing protein [Desulfarculaceae bacterium]|nr:autotransporter domain-containing protein [Desulfarculaceae bacterium]
MLRRTSVVLCALLILTLCAAAPSPAADAVNPAGGIISGNWDGTTADDNYDNQGMVLGDVDMTQGGQDTLSNSGEVAGDVLMSAEGGNLVVNSGTVGVSIHGSHNAADDGSGQANRVVNTGEVGWNLFGGANLGERATSGSHQVSNSGLVMGDIVGSSNQGDYSSGGSNTVGNTGRDLGLLIGSHNLGTGSNGGSNSVSNSGWVFFPLIGSHNEGDNSSGDSNTVTNSGHLVTDLYGSVNDGDGASGGGNTVSNSGTVQGFLMGTDNYGDNTSGGSNTVTNSGRVWFPVIGSYNQGANSAGGSNTVSNTGRILIDLYGSANDGDGASGGGNTVSNSGTVAGYVMGTDNHGDNTSGGGNTVVNRGTVGLDLIGSNNTGANTSSTGNTIVNSGTVSGGVYGSVNSGAGSSGGDDTITNSGTVGGGIHGADGDDKIVLVGGCSLGGVADGGTGDDTLGLNNMGAQDGSLWGSTYLNFENLETGGSGSTILTGTWAVSGTTGVRPGATLKVDSAATFTTAGLNIESGGAASIGGTATVNGATTNAGNLGLGGTLNTSSLANSGELAVGGTLNTTSLTNTGNLGVGGILNTTSLVNSGDLAVGGSVSTTSLDNSGVLNVGGALNAASLVNSGTLAGGGTITGDVVNSGTVSPGNSIGTISIVGNFTNSPSGVLAVELARGRSDLLAVSGTATLNGGTLRASLRPGVYLGSESWTVLSAGSLVGGFSSLEFVLDSVVLSLAMSSGADSVSLRLDRASYTRFADSADTRAVAASLDAIVPLALGQSGEMPDLIAAMDFSYSAGQITRALGQLSPEMYGAFTWAALRGSQTVAEAIGLELDQQRDRGLEPAGAAPDRGALWVRLLEAKAERDGSGNNLGYGQELYGLLLGGQGRAASWLELGGAFGISRGDLSWDAPSYWGRAENLHAALYGRARRGAWHGRATLAFTRQEAQAHRSLALAHRGLTATADFDGYSGLAGLEGGYDFHLGGVRLGPLAALRYAQAELESFDESGAGSLGLAVGRRSAESLQSALGLEAAAAWSAGGLSLLPRASLAWWHEFKDDPLQVDAAFQGYGSAPFTVTGLGLPSDYLAISAGLSARMSQRLEAGLELSLALGDDFQAQMINLGLRLSF